jgi:hypothetical protein
MVRGAPDVILEGGRDAGPECLDNVEDVEPGPAPPSGGGERRAWQDVAGIADGTGHLQIETLRCLLSFFLAVVCFMPVKPVLRATNRGTTQQAASAERLAMIEPWMA